MSVAARLALVSAAIAALGAMSWLFTADPTLETKLTVYDALVKPGEQATLRAKLEQRGVAGINPDLKGYPLEFAAAPEFKAAVKTGKDGAVEAVYTLPEKAGNVVAFQVSFLGSRHHKPSQGAGRVFLWPEDAPILVTDIDHTISDFSQTKLGFTDNADIPPLKGAPEALTELAKAYRVVYLTAREDALFNKTKDWLNLHKFPEGPLFTRDNLITTTQEGFKTEFLKGLRKRYPKLLVGVAERPADARAYLENKMTPYMIDPTGKVDFPKGTVVVNSWEEIREKLAENPLK